MGVACVWLGIASKKTYTIFILGRAFLGVFEAPIESIVPSTVTDIFFLHDRGEKVSIYGLSVLGGNELGPMFSAFIIQSLGINWAFYIVAMFIGLNLVTMFFFMPETKYTGYRPAIVPGDLSFTSEKGSASHIEKLGEKMVPATHEESEPSITKHSRIRSLIPWGKNDPSVSLLRAFLRPFILIAYPTVLWSCVIYGMALSWNVVLGSTVAQLFAPPYAAFPRLPSFTNL